MIISPGPADVEDPSVVVAGDSVPSAPSDVVDPSVAVVGESIPPGPSDVEDPSVVVAGDSIPPAPSDVEDPSLGVTDGGLLVRGLPSQGSLVGVDVEREVNIIFGGGRKLADLVIGHPSGSFSKAEANFEELKL